VSIGPISLPTVDEERNAVFDPDRSASHSRTDHRTRENVFAAAGAREPPTHAARWRRQRVDSERLVREVAISVQSGSKIERIAAGLRR